MLIPGVEKHIQVEWMKDGGVFEWNEDPLWNLNFTEAKEILLDNAIGFLPEGIFSKLFKLIENNRIKEFIYISCKVKGMWIEKS